ncbi:MAG: SDR family oxidoreductase [Ardenticatenaceae bacterium]|nr:SDR family oxidoreductase [Ardenticatenaceae bacterium]MCB9442948.1 SDR family oxidoreductase [Ardenticatenaceae bacterium]
MKYILITGASTGIGYDAARYLIERGYHVFGSVRKQADAERVQAALGERFTPLLFDVTDEAGVKTAVSQIQQTVGSSGLYGLVNNAGIAVPGPLMHLTLDEIRYQLEVNVIGLLSVTKACLPLLGAGKDSPCPPGRIINISSTNGRNAFPFVGPYSASKHALEAITDALRGEMSIYGIKVIGINPGPIQTPIWDKADALDPTPFLGTDYEKAVLYTRDYIVARGRKGLPVEAVSTVIGQALESKRPKTRYPVVRSRLFDWLLPQLLPDRVVDHIVIRALHVKL